MANKIKLRRGLSTAVSNLQLEDGEVVITTDTNKLYSKNGILNPDVTNISGNAASATTANKVSKTLTVSKNGTNTVFDGSTARTISVPTVHYGTEEPSDSLGQDGDIYIVIEG